MTNKLLLIILFVVLSKAVFSQEKIAFSVEAVNQPLDEVFVTIEDLFGVRFSYIEKTVQNNTVTLTKKKRTLKEILQDITKQTQVKFSFINNRYIIATPIKNDNVFSVLNIQQLQSVILFGYLTKGITKNKDGSFVLKPKKQGI